MDLLAEQNLCLIPAPDMSGNWICLKVQYITKLSQGCLEISYENSPFFIGDSPEAAIENAALYFNQFGF